jgi:hypothetical protein
MRASGSPGRPARPIATGCDKWWDIGDRDEMVAAEFLPAHREGLERILPRIASVGLPDGVAKRSINLIDGGVLRLQSPARGRGPR